MHRKMKPENVQFYYLNQRSQSEIWSLRVNCAHFLIQTFIKLKGLTKGRLLYFQRGFIIH